ncbi:tetratricopeptide repeat protein [Vampirovibrio sp.]|uniref:tetratricopeptide repeat protein n=1 Tax=Vampirovibrio sp. TaxID=2717857 RepID=UPI0035942B4F
MNGLSGHRVQRTFLCLLALGCLLSPQGAWSAENLEALITQGNLAAEQQNFSAAIQAYEKAIQIAPQEKTLKNNLAVLYANHAVGLQDQKKYDQAFQYLDKATAIAVPGSASAKNIQGARASLYFSQAMDLKENNANPTPADYQNIRALLNQALALGPDELAFKKGLAGTYLDEAYQLAVQEKFTEAAPLLEKALSYDPKNPAIKQSLANVYLGLGRNDAANRKNWIDKALAMDHSPKIQQVADRLLAIDSPSASAQGKGGFAANPSEARGKAPKAISRLSVADMLRDMESQLQITPPKNATFDDRLATLETQVLGKPEVGAMAIRAKTVYTALMGESDGLQDQSSIDTPQAPAMDSQNSYLDEIFKVTDGKVVRWGRFPLRVYFEEPKENPLYKAEYKEAALKGFEVWKDHTDGYVKFLEIKNPQAADVVVNWTAAYVDRFADPETVSSVYKTYTPPKRSRLLTVVQMASAFAPGYFSLVPQAAAAGLQYQQYKKLAILQEESKIYLGLNPTQTLAPDAAKMLIQNMAAKEFGHALGLKGSSPQQGDLLYPELRSDAPQIPTYRDLTTLRELYNRTPNIILNVN